MRGIFLLFSDLLLIPMTMLEAVPSHITLRTSPDSHLRPGSIGKIDFFQ